MASGTGGDYDVTGWIADVPISLILIFALGSIGIYGFIVGGWASESKYSLLGSMRTCAQMVSVRGRARPLGARRGAHGRLPVARRHRREAAGDGLVRRAAVRRPARVLPIAGIAETNRPPFDLPEAESELVAGYHTEFGGIRWGAFQVAEYINMIVLCSLMVTLFFGGWGGPGLPGPIWFIIKLALAITAFIWLRATLPRLRYDQLMRFGWKVLLPVATLNALVTAVLVVAVE